MAATWQPHVTPLHTPRHAARWPHLRTHTRWLHSGTRQYTAARKHPFRWDSHTGHCLVAPPPPPLLEGGGGRGGVSGQRRVGSKNSQTTPAITSTSSIRQLLGATDAQTAHPATFSTAPTHQLRGSANAETTPARAPAAAADKTQQPDATCEGKNG